MDNSDSNSNSNNGGREKKPAGYYRIPGNLEAEIRAYRAKHPGPAELTAGRMRANGWSGLANAITRGDRGWPWAREVAGHPALRRKSPTDWKAEGALESEIRAYAQKFPDLAEFVHARMVANGWSGLANAIVRSGRDMDWAREVAGHPRSGRKSFANWKAEGALEREIRAYAEKFPDPAEFAYGRMEANGWGGLAHAITRSDRDMAWARSVAGHPPLPAHPLALRAAALTAELEQLIASLGEHIHSLPMKSWLAILRKSEALEAIGSKSALHPVKVRLLEGRITPADIAPPAPAAADAGADGAPLRSRLQEALDAVVAAAGGADAVDEEDEGETVPPAAEALPADTQEDTQERRARLLSLRPEQRLRAVAAVARVCGDEATIRSIALTHTELHWAQMFAASDEEAAALVAEMRATVPSDPWGALVRDWFLAEYRLIEETTEIPSLVLPEGFTLNLMQRREAALLLRDRRRLNLSGMGGGKTLSAIAAAQLAGLNRVLVVCPNGAIPTWQAQLSVHLPGAAVAAKTWAPVWQREDCPRWLLVNHEMLGDRGADGLALFLHEEQPELVVIDELHQCKMRDQETESQRHRNLAEMARRIREQDGFLYGMTGTPLVNELSEAVDLIALVNPELAQGLSTKLSVDSCLAIHDALQPISTRYLPPPAAEVVERTIESRADHLLDEVLEAGQRSLTAVDAVLVSAKLDDLVALAKEPGKLVVFTSAVTGVVGEAQRALKAAGIKSAVFTGEVKEHGGLPSTDAFARDPSVKVLLATTSCLSTGFNGLQWVAGRVAFLTLPWTSTEREQAEARIVRQGCAFEKVEVTTLVATLTDPETGEDWSLDRQKLERLTTKRSVAAAVADGVIPEREALRWSETAVRKAIRSWARRVQQQRQQGVAA